jgi:hypothetical protein
VTPREGEEAPTPQGRGRFGRYDVLSQQKYWDVVTRSVVTERLKSPVGLRFFTASEAETASALLDLLLAQDGEPRVPVLEMVDLRLSEGETDGWRYEDLPEDGEAWRQSLACLDDDSKEHFGCAFKEAARSDQVELLQGIADAEKWHGWVASHIWSLWTRYACAAFYSHPMSWNEIGFGGPAYPRGYKVLHPGWLEPFEQPEEESEDPVPWAERVEAARRAHEVRE